MEKSFRVNIDEDLQRRFKAAVARSGKKIKDVVRAFVSEYVEKEEEGQKNKKL